MAITADTVYSGSQMTQYNPLPMGFYHNVAAADNSATTIVDDKMSTTKDITGYGRTIAASDCSMTLQMSMMQTVYVDGTLVANMNGVDATKSMDVIVPLNTNLKVNLSNQTDTTSQNVQVYVTFKELNGSASA